MEGITHSSLFNVVTVGDADVMALSYPQVAFKLKVMRCILQQKPKYWRHFMPGDHRKYFSDPLQKGLIYPHFSTEIYNALL